MDVNFFPPESIIMTHALMSEHSIDAQKGFIEQQPFLTLPVFVTEMFSQGSAGNKLPIPLMRPPSSPLRCRHKPSSYKVNA